MDRPGHRIRTFNASTLICGYNLNNTNSNTQSEWNAEFQFRGSGQERSGGNLQLWYTKDGQTRVGTSSIYTVGQFDGFALVIDTHGGRVKSFINLGVGQFANK